MYVYIDYITQLRELSSFGWFIVVDKYIEYENRAGKETLKIEKTHFGPRFYVLSNTSKKTPTHSMFHFIASLVFEKLCKCSLQAALTISFYSCNLN